MLIDLATQLAVVAAENYRGRSLLSGKNIDKANADAYSREAHLLHTAERYWLDVRQMEQLRAADFRLGEFPRLPFPNIFVEFNGSLHFEFIPWIRTGLSIDLVEENAGIPSLHPNDRRKQQGTDYRAVHIKRLDPPHASWESNFPKDKTVIRASWVERPSLTEEDETTLDTFSLSFTEDSWPNIFYGIVNIEHDDTLHPGERNHAQRLFQMTVNLLYFLTADNVTQIRITPEHRERFHKDLKELPKSTKPYRVLPFQLPRYRYLHKKHNKDTGRTVKHQYSVVGHIRHLTSDRFERNTDGSVRTVWIPPHQRGLGNPIKMRLRTGQIDPRMLDYDKFIQYEEQKFSHPGFLKKDTTC